MSKIYDVYNLEEDLDDILEDIANEQEEPIPYVKDCYESLVDREGFLDYIQRNDDGLFYECLFDLVSRRILAETKLAKAMIECEKYGESTEDILYVYNIESIDESVDNAIYNSYGIEAQRYLTPSFRNYLGFNDENANYEDFGVANGRKVLFKGGIPKDE